MSDLILVARPDYIAPGAFVVLLFLALWWSDRRQRYALYLGLSFAVAAITAGLAPANIPLDRPVVEQYRYLAVGILASGALMVVGGAQLAGWSRRHTLAAVALVTAIPVLGTLRIVFIGPVGVADLIALPANLVVALALWTQPARVLRLAGALLALRGLNLVALTGVIPGYTLIDRVAVNQVLAYTAGVLLLLGSFMRVMEELAAERDLLQEEVARRSAVLHANRETLASANDELQQLASAVSLALNGPLQRLRELAGGLLDGERAARLDATGRGYVDRMIGATTRMQQIVQSLYELSRAASHPLVRERLDLGALAQECFAHLRARHAGPAPEFTVEDGLVVEADRALLTSVMENLLDNAWKYSAKNPAPRIVFARSTHAAHGFVVRDNGAGFDPEEAHRLFTPFQRLHDARDFEGTGVGLATVQRIVARHGGRIWAEGRPGEGAAFHFTLGDT